MFIKSIPALKENVLRFTNGSLYSFRNYWSGDESCKRILWKSKW
jgi:hypothetical protein